jgi:hypothetical protein
MFATAFAHLERPIVLWRQLGICSICDPGCRAVVETQQYPIAGLELDIAVGLVMGVLHVILCLQQTLPDLSQERVSLE